MHRAAALCCASWAAAFLLGTAQAKVPEALAANLGHTLTAVGAEVAGNAEGTVPVWQGGLTAAPPCSTSPDARLCDPYAEEMPLAVLRANGVTDELARKLSAGQRALLSRYPETYLLPLYPTHRSAAYPAFIQAATRRNALQTELAADGMQVTGAAQGVPFPIPQSGQEAIWNHLLRYRGAGLLRSMAQVTVGAAGDREEIAAVEAFRFSYGPEAATLESLDNVLFDVFQVVTQPARLTGQAWLLKQTLDTQQDPREFWRYDPVAKRTRQIKSAGYDSPALAAEDLLTEDQFDAYSGPLDRYQWKLVGKREMWVPYNAYRLHQSERIDGMLRAAHLNQELARYELHRVWVVEARIKPNTHHLFAKRVFYLDEDSWQIVLVDLYDRSGQLVRVQEVHTVQSWRGKPLALLPVVETSYDLASGRYAVRAYGLSEPGLAEADFESSYFKSGNLRRRVNDFTKP